jgi:hypothetical protein
MPDILVLWSWEQLLHITSNNEAREKAVDGLIIKFTK